MPATRQRGQLLEDTAVLYVRAAHVLDPLRLLVWEELGITLPQLRILFEIRNRPTINLRGLGERLNISKSSASQQVDRLVEHGMLTRAEHATDRRRKQLALTGQGQQAAETISETTRGYVQHLLNTFTSEQLSTLSLLLTSLLDAADTAPPPQLVAQRPASR